MKKTLLAAVLAATFGASAAFAGVSVVSTSNGNPFDLTVSGSVGLDANGAYTSFSNYADGSHYSASKSSFDLKAKDVSLGFDVNAPLMGDFSGFASFTLKFGNGSAKYDSYNFGVQNDQFGTLSFGDQGSAAGDFKLDNSPGKVAVDSVGTTDNQSVSLKYASPDFNGVTFGVSVGGVGSTSDSSKADKDASSVNNSTFHFDALSFGAQFAQGPVTVGFTMEGQKSTETADGKDVHHYGSFTTTLGGSFQYENLTAYAFMGLSTNDYVNLKSFTALTSVTNEDTGVKLPFGSEHVAQFGGNVGVSFDATDADNVNVALKAATVYSNKPAQILNKKGVMVDHNMHYYMFGTEVQATHKFSSNFSVNAYVAYDHLGVSLQDKPEKLDLPSSNNVKYGLGLKYKF